MKRLIVLL